LLSFIFLGTLFFLTFKRSSKKATELSWNYKFLIYFHSLFFLNQML
jgi:hypothetical protein